MRMLHALLAAPVIALALGTAPAVAATALPTAEEATRLVTQAVNARAVTTTICNENKKNGPSKPAVDYIRDIGFGRVTYDVSIFNFTRAGERMVTKLQGDWEHDRTAVDPDKAAWTKLVSAPSGCWRLPLGLYTVSTVSNVRAGDAENTALADYTFTVAPTSFGDTLVKNKSDTQVDADPLVAVPSRPVFLSFYIDNAKKPLAAQAKLAFTGGSWHVVP